MRPDAAFSRTDLSRELDVHAIGNHILFGEILLRQPAFVQMHNDNPNSLRVAISIWGTEEIINMPLILGAYTGLIPVMLKAEGWLSESAHIDGFMRIQGNL